MLLFVILIGIFLVSGGVVFAGQLSYDFFNSPLSLPAAHPATATTIPATATVTATVIETAATATDDTAAATATVEEPTVTPIILETPSP
jgi:carbohydrate-binding DOMON domain-containing protein